MLVQQFIANYTVTASSYLSAMQFAAFIPVRSVQAPWTPTITWCSPPKESMSVPVVLVESITAHEHELS